MQTANGQVTMMCTISGGVIAASCATSDGDRRCEGHLRSGGERGADRWELRCEAGPLFPGCVNVSQALM